MKQRIGYGIAFLLIGLGLFLTTHGPLAAQGGQPKVQVTVAWDGRDHGLWKELQVVLDQDEGTWQGELIVENTKEALTYRIPLELPPKAHKLYRIPVFVGNATALNLSLQDKAGYTTKIPVQMRFTPANNVGRVCAVSSTSVPSSLRGCDVVYRIEDIVALPEFVLAWDGVDVLLLDGVSTASLSEAQQAALASWVAWGGNLIIGGGDTLRGTLEGLPPRLRIAEVTGAPLLRTGSLLPDMPERTWSVSNLRPTGEAKVILELDGNPFALQQEVGLGEVVIFGTSLAPLWQTEWFSHRLEAHPVPAIQIGYISGFNNLNTASSYSSYPSLWYLSQVPNFKLRSVFGVLLIVLPLLYVLLMGPGTMTVVRRLRKPLLAWIMLPALIVGMTLLLYAVLTLEIAGIFPLAHVSSLMFVPDGQSPARVLSYYAFYAPRWHTLTWTSQAWTRPLDGSYTSEAFHQPGEPVKAMVSDQGTGTKVHLQRLAGMITWMEESTMEAPEIRVALTYDPDKAMISGTLWSAHALRNVYLVQADSLSTYYLSDALSAGVESTITRGVELSLSSDFLMDFSQNVLQNLSRGCFLLAESDPAFTSALMRLLGTGYLWREQLWVYKVPCPQIKPVSDSIIFDPSDWTVRSSDHSIEENNWLPIYSYESSGSVDYYAHFPISLSGIQSLTIELELQSGLDPAMLIQNIEVFDWQTGDWVTLPDALVRDGSLTLTGDDAVRFVEPGQVHLSFRVFNRVNSSGGYDRLKFNLTLQGQP